MVSMTDYQDPVLKHTNRYNIVCHPQSEKWQPLNSVWPCWSSAKLSFSCLRSSSPWAAAFYCRLSEVLLCYGFNHREFRSLAWNWCFKDLEKTPHTCSFRNAWDNICCCQSTNYSKFAIPPDDHVCHVQKCRNKNTLLLQYKFCAETLFEDSAVQVRCVGESAAVWWKTCISTWQFLFPEISKLFLSSCQCWLSTWVTKTCFIL